MSVQKPNRIFSRSIVLLVISLASLMLFNSCSIDISQNTKTESLNELNCNMQGDQSEPDKQTNQKILPKVLTAESFLADITKNIAGDRLEIDTLMTLGLDPHSFEPSPGDVVKITESDILIINGSGFEEWLSDIITGANEKIIIVECSKSLISRKENEFENEGKTHENGSEEEYRNKEDPHFWLDPNPVKVYVQNIKEALIESDPEGKDFYNRNAEEYIIRLIELDKWIIEEVKKIPVKQRLLVTNHESLGYFADRYGFKIIGTIIPSSSSAYSPSAKELSKLIEKIKNTGVKAIFLETGSDPEIANQIARETGIKVVTKLYTHSISEPGGPAPTYIDMIRFNTKAIVEFLK
jgi:ABC-type Zn uptake system ZnuABC Zn-binding protein ZnuA